MTAIGWSGFIDPVRAAETCRHATTGLGHLRCHRCFLRPQPRFHPIRSPYSECRNVRCGRWALNSVSLRSTSVIAQTRLESARRFAEGSTLSVSQGLA